MLKITINGVIREYPEGISFEEIAREYQPEYDDTIALVLENGKIRELMKKATKDFLASFS